MDCKRCSLGDWAVTDGHQQLRSRRVSRYFRSGWEITAFKGKKHREEQEGFLTNFRKIWALNTSTSLAGSSCLCPTLHVLQVRTPKRQPLLTYLLSLFWLDPGCLTPDIFSLVLSMSLRMRIGLHRVRILLGIFYNLPAKSPPSAILSTFSISKPKLWVATREIPHQHWTGTTDNHVSPQIGPVTFPDKLLISLYTVPFPVPHNCYVRSCYFFPIPHFTLSFLNSHFLDLWFHLQEKTEFSHETETSSCSLDFPGGSDGKASAYNAGDVGLIPGLGRFPGEGNGNPLQYSFLENPIDRGTW